MEAAAAQVVLAKPYLVISRALLHFTCLTLEKIPSSQVEATLRLQILLLSPYPKFGFAWQKKDTSYSIYFWDAAKVEANMVAQGMAPHEAIPVPEPFLKEVPTQHLLLTSRLEGYEGICANNGQIVASRWWSTPPSASECSSFIRDSGLQATETIIAPISLSWLEKLPAEVSVQSQRAKISISEPFFIQILVMLIGLAITLVGVRHLKLESAISQRRAEISVLDPQVRNTIKLHQQAEDDAALSRRLVTNEDNGEVLTALAHLVSTGLGEKSGITLRDFELRSGRLRISLTSKKGNIPRTLFLERLAALPGFSNARLLSDNDPLVVIIETEITLPLPTFVPPRDAPPLLPPLEQKPKTGNLL